MKKSLRIWMFCLMILVGAFSSCVYSLDTLSDQYNENFKKNTMLELLAQQMEQKQKEDVYPSPKPGDPDFDEDDMLFDEYFVYDDGTLNLSAPPSSYNYKWVVRDPELGYREVEILKFWEGSGKNQREFVIYIPDSGLETKTYQLSLTVYDVQGKEYSDVCGLIVYDHLNYKKESVFTDGGG